MAFFEKFPKPSSPSTTNSGVRKSSKWIKPNKRPLKSVNGVSNHINNNEEGNSTLIKPQTFNDHSLSFEEKHKINRFNSSFNECETCKKTNCTSHQPLADITFSAKSNCESPKDFHPLSIKSLNKKFGDLKLCHHKENLYSPTSSPRYTAYDVAKKKSKTFKKKQLFTYSWENLQRIDSSLSLAESDTRGDGKMLENKQLLNKTASTSNDSKSHDQLLMMSQKSWDLFFSDTNFESEMELSFAKTNANNVCVSNHETQKRDDTNHNKESISNLEKYSPSAENNTRVTLLSQNSSLEKQESSQITKMNDLPKLENIGDLPLHEPTLINMENSNKFPYTNVNPDKEFFVSANAMETEEVIFSPIINFQIPTTLPNPSESLKHKNNSQSKLDSFYKFRKDTFKMNLRHNQSIEPFQNSNRNGAVKNFDKFCNSQDLSLNSTQSFSLSNSQNLCHNLENFGQASNSGNFEDSFDSQRLNNLSDSQKRLNEKIVELSRNIKLIYTGPEVKFDDQLKKIKQREMLTKIEEILLNFISSLAAADICFFGNVPNVTPLSRINKSQDEDNIVWPEDFNIMYNSKGVRQKKSSIVIFLLGKIYSLINQNAHCSQRQIYYELKHFVANQEVVASNLITVCELLKVEPWYLPINSSGKGLVFGNLKVTLSNERVIDCLNYGGTLIPQDVTEIKGFDSNARFILVIEKDSVFKKILDEDINATLSTSCIVITGRGFPDFNTRLFSKLLWHHLRIPIFILTDGDPYGIDIMLTYRFGTTKHPQYADQISIPKMQWIGILPSDIENLQIPGENLQKSDIKKLKVMLERPYIRQLDWLKREIEIMLKHKKKAGIEGVIDNHQSLTKFYLVSKFFSNDYL